MQKVVARLLPAREGHFEYESGHHGRTWLDLEVLFLEPDKVRPLAEELGQRLARHRPEVICGPLVEGAFVGLMVASFMGLPFSYSVQILPARRDGLFAVSYSIPRSLRPHLEGRRVAVVNDVIGAGSAVGGSLKSLCDFGADPVVLGSLAAYGSGAERVAEDNGLSLEVLASFPNETWIPEKCPLCADGVPVTPWAAT